MRPEAMEPYGRALLAYSRGDTDAELVLCRDDGRRVAFPVAVFFRDSSNFSPIDRLAIERCQGHVLDIGAGTGSHSLALQEKGLPVTAIDLSPQAVRIMKERGLPDVLCVDVFEFDQGRFDTLLMMGHGIGIVETIAGLERFLTHARNLLTKKGQILLDSLDVRMTDNPTDLAYHDRNRRAGRFIGEIRMHFEFEDQRGPVCGWLQVDPATLSERAASLGWMCETLRQEDTGDHLSRLTLSTSGGLL